MRKGFFGSAGLLLPIAAARAAFVPLDLPGSQLIALSRDGCVAAGSLLGGDAGGFRWSAHGGVERLRSAATVRGLSASGRYVAGSLLDEHDRQVAAYWDASGRPHRLGTLAGSVSIGQVSEAFGITDEPRIVGSVRRAAEGHMAFVWSAAGGMRELPTPDGGSARALGIGDAGRVYGWMQTTDGLHGVAWYGARSYLLRGASGEPVGEVLGADRRGEVLLGISERGDGGHSVYRWSDDGGARFLPVAHASMPLHLFASSDDGRILVGGAGTGDRREAVLWIEGRSVVTLVQWLAERAIELPSHWRPSVLTAISGDGQRLAGWGTVDGRLDSFVIGLESSGAAKSCSSGGS